MTLKAAWNALFAKDDTNSDKEQTLNITPKPVKHDFDQFDRIQSAELRRIRQNIERMNAQAQELHVKKQLEDAQRALYDDDDYDDDDYEEEPQNDLDRVLSAFMPILNNSLKKNDSNKVVKASSEFGTQTPALEITDEEIRAFISAQDKAKIKLAKQLPKQVIKNQVKEMLGADESTAERAHQILISEY